MDRPLLDVPADSLALTEALAAALAGSGPAVRVLPPTSDERRAPRRVAGAAHDEDPGPAARALPPASDESSAPRRAGGAASDEPAALLVPAGVAVVLRTSGSTGEPRDVMLSAAALAASATATQRRLGGPGDWLLVLPPDHVAGLQVVLRALAAGTAVHRGPAGPFRPAGFAAAATAMPPGRRRYTSLVPTQLVRLLDSPAGVATLRTFDAVLLGGAAIPAALLARARAAGVPVVTTYGMTETCGGCVYDGVPLDGVRVRIEEAGPAGAVGGGEAGTAAAAAGATAPADPGRGDRAGRILLAGPVLAEGYLGHTDVEAGTGPGDDGTRLPGSDASAFVTDDDGARLLGVEASAFVMDDEGTRWLRTSDLGSLDASGRLTVLGRADDVIVTGGVNVAPTPVEELLHTLPGVREACVVGVPDDEWGQAVVAVLVTGPDGPPPLADVRALVTERLGAAAAPRRLVVVPALPTRGPGKPDRRAAATLAALA